MCVKHEDFDDDDIDDDTGFRNTVCFSLIIYEDMSIEGTTTLTTQKYRSQAEHSATKNEFRNAVCFSLVKDEDVSIAGTQPR